jgi:hypothetical protein
MTYSVNTEGVFFLVYIGFQGKIKIQNLSAKKKNGNFIVGPDIRCFIGVCAGCADKDF